MPSTLQNLRRTAFLAQDCRCYYCRQAIYEDDAEAFCDLTGIRPGLAKWLRSTAEHLVAVQDGGLTTAQNVVAACLYCNTCRHIKRADRAPSAAVYAVYVASAVGVGRWHPVAASNAARHSRN